jgi:hypothetical protein
MSILTPEALEQMSSHTNAYRRYCTRVEQSGKRKKKNNHTLKWKDTTIDDIKALLGLLYIFGICSLPELESYWSHSLLFSNMGVKEIMPRDRFW